MSSRVMSAFWVVADVKSENHYDPHKSHSLISWRCSSTTSRLVIDVELRVRRSIAWDVSRIAELELI